jgi:hypothetical protein
MPSFQHNVHVHGGHRTFTKSCVPLPLGGAEEHPYEQPGQVDEETMRKAGIPLDDDPFAKAEGVRMLSPTSKWGCCAEWSHRCGFFFDFGEYYYQEAQVVKGRIVGGR